MIKFEQGKTYSAYQSGGDGDDGHYIDFFVMKRTTKRITIQQTNGMADEGKVVTVGIGIDERDGIEYAYPDGKYTGALIIRSNRLSKNNKAKAKKLLEGRI